VSAADAIQLDTLDQVATVLRRVRPGETVEVAAPDRQYRVTATEAIPIYHKIALRTLPAGADVRKYGDVIGRLTAPVAEGALVHLHNLRSRRAARGD
jgi:hypothetical protein